MKNRLLICLILSSLLTACPRDNSATGPAGDVALQEISQGKESDSLSSSSTTAEGSGVPTVPDVIFESANVPYVEYSMPKSSLISNGLISVNDDATEMVLELLMNVDHFVEQGEDPDELELEKEESLTHESITCLIKEGVRISIEAEEVILECPRDYKGPAIQCIGVGMYLNCEGKFHNANKLEQEYESELTEDFSFEKNVEQELVEQDRLGLELMNNVYEGANAFKSSDEEMTIPCGAPDADLILPVSEVNKKVLKKCARKVVKAYREAATDDYKRVKEKRTQREKRSSRGKNITPPSADIHLDSIPE